MEEALVEKEVYDAMMQMRNEVNAIARTPSSKDSPVSSSGRSPEWEFVYGDGDIPEPGQKNKGPVSSDVMALGDVDRDPKKPVAGYIPPTAPSGGSNPFPMLDGPMG